MANLDYSLAIEELQPLEGLFFDKFYELPEGRFRLKLGKTHILIELPLRIHKTKYLEKAPEPSSFAMKVRKELKGKKLSSIHQHERDRVVVFDFEGTLLIAEMFGKGNIFLVRDGKVLSAWEKPREKMYSFPLSGEKTLEDVFSSSSPEPVAAEMRLLNIGMPYVRAVLKDAGVPDSRPVSELSDSEKKAISSSYEKVLSSPARFSAFTKGKEPESFSQALDEHYGPPKVSEKPKKQEEMERLARLLENQEARLKELEEKEEVSKKKADLIYSHYDEVEALLLAYRKGGMKSVENLAEKKGWNLNKKKKELELQLGD